MTPEIRKADPAAQRRALTLVIGGLVAGLSMVLVFEHYSEDLVNWVLAEPALMVQRLKILLIVTGGILAIPMIFITIWMWSLGGRVIRAGEYPPPGPGLTRDTRVVTGPAALLRGRILRALSVLQWLVLGAFGLLLWKIINSALGSSA